MSDSLGEFREQIGQASAAAERALQILEGSTEIRRSVIFRLLLGRAVSILLGIHGQELQRKENEVNGSGD